MDCDVTLRNLASARLGAEELPQTAPALLLEVGGFLSQPALAQPSALDGLALNASGVTMQNAWTPW